MTIHSAASEAEIADIVREAAGQKHPLDIVGGNSRVGLGRPREAEVQLHLSRLTGVTFYEPAELVIGARAGTPLSEITALIGQRGQMLPFEPMDHRGLYGGGGEPSIGGLAACNVSGPRRPNAGAARDALIGVRFVNGRGQVIGAGGRVMKNVTGLDLVKLSAGAHGTLGVLTEVIFKLLPVPERAETLVYQGLEDNRALELMAAAFGSAHEVSAAAHLPAGPSRDVARTYLRVEGLAHAVEVRLGALRRELGEFGDAAELGPDETERVWQAIRDAQAVAAPPEREVWRVSVAASRAGKVMPALGPADGLTHFFDWGGGLVWIASAGDIAGRLREVAVGLGGHATLVRASAERRATVPVFQPLGESPMALTRGVKLSLDPEAVINRGRMYQGI